MQLGDLSLNDERKAYEHARQLPDVCCLRGMQTEHATGAERLMSTDHSYQHSQ